LPKTAYFFNFHKEGVEIETLLASLSLTSSIATVDADLVIVCDIVRLPAQGR